MKDKEKLESIIKTIKSKYGEGSIMRLTGEKISKVDVIPTGSFSLDLALGIGGFPRGRIVEIFGPEGGGKSTLALHTIAEAQKLGGNVAYIDAEHALDPEYAKRLGVKINDVLISQPNSGEEALNILESLIRSQAISVIIVDSVAALTPQVEIEGEMTDTQIGLQARMMSKALRKIGSIVAKTNTLVIFINQIRMKIGMMFGNPETTPGGRALKFYASVRVDIRASAKIKKGDEIVGHRVNVKIVKNKLAPPFKKCEFDIIYGQGISYLSDVLNTGLKTNVIKKSGNTYYFNEQKLGVGTEKAKEYLKQNPKLLQEIKARIKDSF